MKSGNGIVGNDSTPYLLQLLGDSSVMNLNVSQNHAVKKSVVQ